MDVGGIRTEPCLKKDGPGSNHPYLRQQWVHVKHPGGTLIKNGFTGKCLASGDAKDGAGARTTWPLPCDPRDRKQLWTVRAI